VALFTQDTKIACLRRAPLFADMTKRELGEVTLDVDGPVDFFGEVSLVEHVPRLATVTATTPLRFFVLGHREFHQLMDDNPRIERKVLLALARRLLTLVQAEEHPTLA